MSNVSGDGGGSMFDVQWAWTVVPCLMSRGTWQYSSSFSIWLMIEYMKTFVTNQRTQWTIVLQ